MNEGYEKNSGSSPVSERRIRRRLYSEMYYVIRRGQSMVPGWLMVAGRRWSKGARHQMLTCRRVPE